MRLLREVYVSVDIESDGPIPGPHSMLSIGAAAFRPDRRIQADEPFKVDRTVISTFEANLETLPFAEAEPSTAEWWQTQPEAWAACRENLQDPAKAMESFVEWVKSLPGIELNSQGIPKNAVFVGYPAGFDFTFVYWYIRFFKLQSPFGFSSFDPPTFGMEPGPAGEREKVFWAGYDQAIANLDRIVMPDDAREWVRQGLLHMEDRVPGTYREAVGDFSVLDIKSLAMRLLGRPFRDSVKRNMPDRWFSQRPHTHVAVDDAIEQGELLMSMLEEWAKRFE